MNTQHGLNWASMQRYTIDDYAQGIKVKSGKRRESVGALLG